MSMIDETALENRRAQLNDEPAAALAADRRWHLGHLATGIAGLVVFVAVGGTVIGSLLGPGSPPLATADRAPEETAPVSAPVVASAATIEVPVAPSVPAAKPDDSQPPADKDMTGDNAAAEAAVVTGALAPPKVEAPPTAKPAELPPAADEADTPPPFMVRADTPPVDKPAAVKAAKVAPSDEPAAPKATALPEAATSASGEVAGGQKAAPAQKMADAAPPVPESKAPVEETKAVVETEVTVATQPARIVSDVKMRAGPGNGEAVLGTLARGTTVELVTCRAWCEVIHDGQHGWVYKGFIDASEGPQVR